jgi:carboxyl-terminal processing protease
MCENFEILFGMSSLKKFFKKFGTSIAVGIIIAGAFAGGMYLGSNKTFAVQGITTTSNNGQPENVDLSAFWKAWQLLDEKFVETHQHKAVTDEDKVYGAIKGLAAAYGDPYTVFFPPEENKSFQTEISGNFEGVGMEMGIKNNVLTVIAPLKDSPASKAGIKAGDLILQINGTTTESMSVDQAVQLIRGKKGTSVTLTVLSENAKQAHEVTIVRDVINIPTIETEQRKDGVFVIKFYTFTENSHVLFKQAIQKFVQTGSNKLILDLRGNPGGYLDSSIDIASWFLPSEAIVVTEDTNGNGKNQVYTSHGYNIFNKNLKMVILVDGGSASASEILAGALQQHNIAKLVGTKTFGKGSVQQLVPLTKDTSLKITIAQWLTPNGTSISAQGLKPDIEIPFTPEDAEKKKDPQMDKAIELLNQ